MISENKDKSLLTENSENNAKLWHRKLGHTFREDEKATNLCEGFSLSLKQLEEVKSICGICQEAKRTRLKFTNVRTKAERSLQIIHTDLCGPIDPQTWIKKRYFLTFKDDYTCYTIVYLLEKKSEV